MTRLQTQHIVKIATVSKTQCHFLGYALRPCTGFHNAKCCYGDSYNAESYFIECYYGTCHSAEYHWPECRYAHSLFADFKYTYVF
jgi:hypothetical protein